MAVFMAVDGRGAGSLGVRMAHLPSVTCFMFLAGEGHFRLSGDETVLCEHPSAGWLSSSLLSECGRLVLKRRRVDNLHGECMTQEAGETSPLLAPPF